MKALLPPTFKDKRLARVAEKALSGERLTAEDGLALFETEDVLSLGLLADAVAEEKNRNLAYFNVNIHINPTNVCAGTCRFCAYRKSPGEPGAFELTVDQILSTLENALKKEPSITEVHIVGGLHPDWSYRRFLDIVRVVKEAFPKLYIKAYTAEEIKHIAQVGGKKVEETVEDLIEAGLDAVPGGGGEIFSEGVRRKLCPDKISGEEYLEIHKLVHRMGLKSNATMLFGHIETYTDRVEHLLKLREAQDETGGFQAFIPLTFHPWNTSLKVPPATAIDELKTVAVSRLILDNFPHIKAYWVLLGEKVAQLALRFGADDIDGTVTQESITRATGSRFGESLPKSRLLRLIRGAGKVPVERDTLYNIIRIHKPLLEL
jgi:aminodeoxyfutalosine synthase